MITLLCAIALGAEPVSVDASGTTPPPENIHQQMLESSEACLRCHPSAPAADAEEAALTQPVMELCLSCHVRYPHGGLDIHQDEIYKPKLTRARKGGLPLSDDDEFICITCHDPHPPGVTTASTARSGWAGERFLPQSWIVEVLNPNIQERSAEAEVTLTPVTHESPLMRKPLRGGELCKTCHRKAKKKKKP